MRLAAERERSVTTVVRDLGIHPNNIYDRRQVLAFIQPGKPAQKAYIQRFSRTYRKEVLNLYSFEGLAEVKRIMEQ